MTLRKILHYPNPKLRHTAKSVDNVDKEIQRLISDMFETMYEDNGIGLAATQIGIDLRIFVVDVHEKNKNPIAFINPVIIEQAGEQKYPEGCLSLPGIFAEIKRAENIKIEALNKEGSNYYDGINEFCTKMKTKVCLSREYISSAGHVKALYGTVNDKSGELNKLNNDNLYYPAKFTKALEMLQINFVFVMSLEEDGYIVWASKTEHDKLQKIIDDFNPNQKNVLKLSLDSKI